MKQFTDKNGRTWDVAVDIAAVKRCRQLLKVDLLDPSSKDTGGYDLLSRLQADDVLLCDVLFAICKPLCDSAGIKDEDFGSAMGGGALAAGLDALLESWADFFRTRRHEPLAQLIEKHREVVAITMELATERMSRIDMEEARSLIVETLGKPSGNSPASPASETPAA